VQGKTEELRSFRLSSATTAAPDTQQQQQQRCGWHPAPRPPKPPQQTPRTLPLHAAGSPRHAGQCGPSLASSAAAAAGSASPVSGPQDVLGSGVATLEGQGSKQGERIHHSSEAHYHRQSLRELREERITSARRTKTASDERAGASVEEEGCLLRSASCAATVGPVTAAAAAAAAAPPSGAAGRSLGAAYRVSNSAVCVDHTAGQRGKETPRKRASASAEPGLACAPHHDSPVVLDITASSTSEHEAATGHRTQSRERAVQTPRGPPPEVPALPLGIRPAPQLPLGPPPPAARPHSARQLRRSASPGTSWKRSKDTPSEPQSARSTRFVSAAAVGEGDVPLGSRVGAVSSTSSSRAMEAARMWRERERLENFELRVRALNLTKQQAMQAFLVHEGVAPPAASLQLSLEVECSTMVFSLDGPDEHIRQALLRRGCYGSCMQWVENKVPGSVFWNLRWCSTDSEEDYRHLHEGDLYNHFQNNRELTTKAGLARSLRQLSVEFQVDIDSFFPRCFDMSVAIEREEFVLDFRRSAAFSVLRQHQRLRSCAGFACNAEVLRTAVRIGTRWLEDLDGTFFEDEEDPQRPKRTPTSDEEWDALVLYSSLSDSQLTDGSDVVDDAVGVPLRSRQRGYSASGGSTSERQDGGPQQRVVHRPADLRAWPEFKSHHWFSQPPHNLEEVVATTLAAMEQKLPQATLQARANAWIVKPGSNSKGNGIMCMRSLPDILHHCGQGTARVVQKYIERPLLICSGRKFDIRQWVLVRSFKPLEAYVFSECYLRLCNEPFDLGDLSNRHRHISNWAVNKHGKLVTEGAVVSLTGFETELRAAGCRDGYWSEVLRPKVEAIVLHCLEAVQHTVVQRSTCFELYGFDVMIDEDLQPWLLEVNLSPACDPRTPWLAELVQRMADRLMDLVVGGDAAPDASPGPEWVRLSSGRSAGGGGIGVASAPTAPARAGGALSGEDSLGSADVAPLGEDNRRCTALAGGASDLAVVGRVLNLRAMRRLDIAWRRKEALQVMQLVARCWPARRMLRQARVAATRLQRSARSWRKRRKLAQALVLCKPGLQRWLHLIRKRRHSAALECQRHLRRFAACELVKHLMKIERLVSKVAARRLQSCWRRMLRRRHAVLRIQCAWRHYRRRICAMRLSRHIQRRALASVWQWWLLHRAAQLRKRREAGRHIWRVWLGYVGRKRLLRSHAEDEAAARIQRSWRWHSARQRLRRRLAGALRLQAFVRGRRARLRSAWELARLDKLVCLSSLTLAVLRWRRRVAAGRAADAARAIQAHWRRRVRAVEASRLWQRSWVRRWKRSLFIRVLAATTMQRAWRLSRSRKHESRVAARLQRWWRALRVRHHEKRGRAARVLQQRWRRRLEERVATAVVLIPAASRIQAAFRGLLGRSQARRRRIFLARWQRLFGPEPGAKEEGEASASPAAPGSPGPPTAQAAASLLCGTEGGENGGRGTEGRQEEASPLNRAGGAEDGQEGAGPAEEATVAPLLLLYALPLGALRAQALFDLALAGPPMPVPVPPAARVTQPQQPPPSQPPLQHGRCERPGLLRHGAGRRGSRRHLSMPAGGASRTQLAPSPPAAPLSAREPRQRPLSAAAR